ncbi:MAG TPA: acyclic terpene utilization AtuA family protein [Noviherbaspirillum sp.]|uniref:acyclic terpene utilization AtuA family protein n=1 Tax=Noviherbaspirillum sp. TaxID=1926288 RepID=UPI002B484298|nr:acyclic terpene utilization AtuA family protein [Noviherbaspirillum sp.]HJV86958.1 acyclic terpene utilization AtuA family protein [Noviherbaspirillum sp.]
MTQQEVIRIGGASGFWGDSSVAAEQLVTGAPIDYLVFDYLAELTMAILASARSKKPELGYATDFVDIAMKSTLKEIAQRRIKVITNAGGINPQGCADALARLAGEMGVSLRIAVVEGDDVSAAIPDLRERKQKDMFTGAGLPDRILSANAYLGALPIAQALRDGADVVITGRCVDSAVTLGPLIHEFGWAVDDYDRLAAGSLAGHIIECGCQATGGLHTDWEQIPDWANIGYPVIECHADGSFVVTKPKGTGGRVLAAAVAEQMLYEIGDPAAYILPDVVCDFTGVRIEQEDENRVRVSGARGLPPTDSYKVSATYMDGYRCAGTLVIIGIDAVAKARRTGEAILERTRAIFRKMGLPDYTASYVEVIGAETQYGPHSRATQSREVMMRVAVNHTMKQALEIFAREIAPAGTSWSPGTTGPALARPGVSPLIKQFAFTLPKREVSIQVRLDGKAEPVEVPLNGGYVPAMKAQSTEATQDAPAGKTSQVPLIKLAWARSGDKGNISNIGVIARKPEYLPLILRGLTPESVKRYFAHLANGPVTRYLVPGIHACNFLLEDALDGGGTASMRMDPLGKGMGQMLLDMPISVPEELASSLGAS